MQDIQNDPTFLDFKQAVEKYFSQATVTPEQVAAAVAEFHAISTKQTQEKPCE